MDMWGKIEDWCKDIASALGGKDIVKQYKCVCLFLNGIQESEGDVIACCTKLVESNTELMFGDYCKDVGEGFVGIEERQCKPTDWQMCFELFIYGYKDMLKFEDESEPKQQREHYLKNINKAMEDEEDGGKEWRWYTKEARGNTYGRFSSFAYYDKAHNTFAYKLCKRLCEYLCKKNNIPDISVLEIQELTKLVKTVCLFTALKNEQARITDDAFTNNIPLPKIPTGDTKPHAGEPKQQGCGETLPDGEKTLKQRFFEALDFFHKERVDKYFERAIKNKYMVETDDGYKWKSGRGQKTKMAYFLVKVFKPDGYESCTIPPMVGALFGIRQKSIYSLNTQANNRKGYAQWMEEMDDNIFYD